MTKFPKSVLEERRAASLKLQEALDICGKFDLTKGSVLVVTLTESTVLKLTKSQACASTR